MRYVFSEEVVGGAHNDLNEVARHIPYHYITIDQESSLLSCAHK